MPIFKTGVFIDVFLLDICYAYFWDVLIIWAMLIYGKIQFTHKRQLNLKVQF